MIPEKISKPHSCNKLRDGDFIVYVKQKSLDQEHLPRGFICLLGLLYRLLRTWMGREPMVPSSSKTPRHTFESKALLNMLEAEASSDNLQVGYRFFWIVTLSTCLNAMMLQ